MADPARVGRRDVPHIEGRLHESVPTDGGPVGQSVGSALGCCTGTVEATFTRNDDSLGDIPQDRVGRTPPRSPCAGSAGGLGLAPDDLAPEKQAQVVLEDARHVRTEAPVRLAAQVCDVHSDTPARLENPPALLEHIAKQGQVFHVRVGNLPSGHCLLVLLPDEVGR